MPDLIHHVDQAGHNRGCATHLIDSGAAPALCHDWAVTAAFYSAVHYVEAGFTSGVTGHTYSHKVRNRRIPDLYGKKCWKSYRKLYNASSIARYLNPSGSRRSVGCAAHRYFTLDQAKGFVTDELAVVKQEVERMTGVNLS